MGRQPRLVADGLIYHAFNRGNNRAGVFFNSGDFLTFVRALQQTKQRYPWYGD
jgi:putative transposase